MNLKTKKDFFPYFGKDGGKREGSVNGVGVLISVQKETGRIGRVGRNRKNSKGKGGVKI